MENEEEMYEIPIDTRNILSPVDIRIKDDYNDFIPGNSKKGPTSTIDSQDKQFSLKSIKPELWKNIPVCLKHALQILTLHQ